MLHSTQYERGLFDDSAISVISSLFVAFASIVWGYSVTERMFNPFTLARHGRKSAQNTHSPHTHVLTTKPIFTPQCRLINPNRQSIDISFTSFGIWAHTHTRSPNIFFLYTSLYEPIKWLTLSHMALVMHRRGSGCAAFSVQTALHTQTRMAKWGLINPLTLFHGQDGRSIFVVIHEHGTSRKKIRVMLALDCYDFFFVFCCAFCCLDAVSIIFLLPKFAVSWMRSGMWNVSLVNAAGGWQKAMAHNQFEFPE